MMYRMARVEDLPQITECICTVKEHGVVDASELDGHIAVIEHEGRIIACVWAMVQGRNCYGDYMSILPEYQHLGFGPRLLVWFLARLREAGVKYIRFFVREDNKEMLRIYQALGVSFGTGYAVGYKRI
ncbi:MAG: hypothetical protein AMJ65_01635 [Phycisphaerae bacterium SG8_4]|nr:MAG: hypothetical protein AMJ65_01635 [Phycisphaerae bacterium SG8_4]